jgi:alpha-methylacyl-CoA racemase
MSNGARADRAARGLEPDHAAMDAPPALPVNGRQGPLAGVRVIELGGIGPAPFAGMLLADLGADVVRIDRPVAGAAEAPGKGSAGNGAAGAAHGAVMERGKRSVALDLKDPSSLEAARVLIDRADVLVDPYRPGVTERLGLGPELCLERNPRLVYVRMTGWGQEGPLAGAAGHDLNYIALAGALHPMGTPDAPPSPPLNLVGDYGGGGMLLAFGVACALYERERSGLGQVLDVAMVDGVAALMAIVCQLQAHGAWSQQRGENFLDGAAPWYRAYATADGRFVTVAAIEPQFYSLLLARLGLDEADWPQWDRGRWPALHARLTELFEQRTLQDWQAALEGTDACFAPALRVEEAAEHPQLAARHTYVAPDGVLQPAPVPRFGRTPGAIHGPPPAPGEHTDEVLAELSSRDAQAALHSPRPREVKP